MRLQTVTKEMHSIPFSASTMKPSTSNEKSIMGPHKGRIFLGMIAVGLALLLAWQHSEARTPDASTLRVAAPL